MIDTTSEQRSDESTSDDADTINSQQSNARGRRHPTTITGRVTYATKGRAKELAERRGISLCQLVREAVQEAVRTHEKSPDAV